MRLERIEEGSKAHKGEIKINLDGSYIKVRRDGLKN